VGVGGSPSGFAWDRLVVILGIIFVMGNISILLTMQFGRALRDAKVDPQQYSRLDLIRIYRRNYGVINHEVTGELAEEIDCLGQIGLAEYIRTKAEEVREGLSTEDSFLRPLLTKINGIFISLISKALQMFIGWCIDYAYEHGEDLVDRLPDWIGDILDQSLEDVKHSICHDNQNKDQTNEAIEAIKRRIKNA